MPRDDYEDDDDDRPRRRYRDDDEDDVRPRRRGPRRHDDDDPPPPAKSGSGKTLAIVLGIIGGAVLLFGGGLAVLVVFLLGKAQESRARKITTGNLSQAVIASHTYHDVYGYLPQPYMTRPTDPRGQTPKDLDTRLGWRVEVLPYMEQDDVYRKFQREQAWNSPANQPLSNVVVSQYADHDTPGDPTTRVRCFYDNGAIFDTRDRFPIVSVSDGTSNTIMYVEGGEKVTWTRFQEYKYDPTGPLPALGRADQPTFMVVMADGSVKTVKKTVSESVLRAAITRAGGEVSYLGD